MQTLQQINLEFLVKYPVISCKCLIKAITCIQHGRKVQFQKTSEV